MSFELSEDQIRTFERDGAICLRQLFSPEWITKATVGIDSNLRNPSIYAEHLQGSNGPGMYFNDYCNWTTIPEFRDYVFNSPAGVIAGQLMRSSKSIFYHEHVLVKEVGTDKKTPWHTDISYYPIDGSQCLSIWMPVDPVEVTTALKFVATSHRWPKWFMPRKFATSFNYPVKYFDPGVSGREWVNVPTDEELQNERILAWSLNPGDCLVFHMKTIHGAAGNSSRFPRRVLSTRWLGDDTVIASRPWDPSPPTTGKLYPGQSPTASPEFPIIWTQNL